MDTTCAQQLATYWPTVMNVIPVLGIGLLVEMRGSHRLRRERFRRLSLAISATLLFLLSYIFYEAALTLLKQECPSMTYGYWVAGTLYAVTVWMFVTVGSMALAILTLEESREIATLQRDASKMARRHKKQRKRIAKLRLRLEGLPESSSAFRSGLLPEVDEAEKEVKELQDDRVELQHRISKAQKRMARKQSKLL